MGHWERYFVLTRLHWDNFQPHLAKGKAKSHLLNDLPVFVLVFYYYHFIQA